MNKQEYISALQKALKEVHVADVDEIVQEYEDHFAYKLADGYAEEEIAARLDPPMDIAKQYEVLIAPAAKKPGKGIIATGLILADIPVSLFFILLYAVVVVLGALVIALIVLGFLLIANMNIASLIPPMPYFAALGFGLSFIALSLLCAVGTIYAFLYVTRFAKMYLRWHSNTLHGNILPPLSLQLGLSGKAKRKLRMASLLCFTIFALLFLISFVGLFASTGFKPFWHALGWFQ